MNISHELTKLPLHYYLGTKKYELRVSPDNMTYIDHRSNTINIGEAMLRDTFKEDLKESDIRSMLYHEVSHAILTKVSYKKDLCDKLGKGLNNEILDFANIFEDERIETLLNGYYKDVNFEKQKRYVCFGGFDNYINKNKLNKISLENYKAFMLRCIRLRRDKDNLGYFRKLASDDRQLALVSRISDLENHIKSYFQDTLAKEKFFFSAGVNETNFGYTCFLDTMELIYKESKEIFKELKEIERKKEKEKEKDKPKPSKKGPKPDHNELGDDENDGENGSPSPDENTEENTEGGSTSPDEPDQDEPEKDDGEGKGQGEEDGEKQDEDIDDKSDIGEEGEELTDEEKEMKMNEALNDMEEEKNILKENSENEIADEGQKKNQSKQEEEHLKKRMFLLGNLIEDGTFKESDIDPMIINFNPYISLREKFMPVKLKGRFVSRNDIGEGDIDPESIEKRPNSNKWRNYKVFLEQSKFGMEHGIGGKKHINIIIDSSGSYGMNVPETYKILKQFEEAFKDCPLVSYDLYICACGIRQIKNADEYMKFQRACGGGNGLTRVDLPILDRIEKQTHQKGNFNVVLFDGQLCGDGTRKTDEHGKLIVGTSEGERADYHYATKILRNAYAILDSGFYYELNMFEPEFTKKYNKNYKIVEGHTDNEYPKTLKGQMYRIIEKIAIADNSLKKHILDPKFKRHKVVEIIR